MKKKFVIMINEDTPANVKDEITNYLVLGLNLEVWHWIENAWLAVTDGDTENIDKDLLRDGILDIAGKAGPIIIVDATGTNSIGGYGNLKQVDWINKHWRT